MCIRDRDGNIQPISREDYERLLAYLKKKNPAAILPIQIAYYAGLRIGAVSYTHLDVYKRQHLFQPQIPYFICFGMEILR